METVLRAARAAGHPTVWAWYQADEQLHLAAQGDAPAVWPVRIDGHALPAFCADRCLHRWPTGFGESVFGWLLAPEGDADNPALATLAERLGLWMQTNTLARVQNTQRVLYEIAYLASSIHDRAAFLLGVHQQLSTLIDAESFYLALYDRASGKVTYPYYVDVIDTDALEAEHFDYLDASRPSLTGRVLLTGQPLLIDADGIRAAEARGEFFCVGDCPEYWMGAPLVNASDDVFGMLAMQVYEKSRVYGVEDRALFLVVARHVAMALDRILHRADLEETVSRRTAELSELNRALRQEVVERKRAEHLQTALFKIAELSSRHGDMLEFFSSLHGIVGELLFARNFYIAFYDAASGTVAFPYYIDESRNRAPAPRCGQRGLTEYVIRQRRPCLIDFDEATRLRKTGELALGEHIRLYSWLGIPLFDGDNVRGVLAVQSYSSEVSYTLFDQELLTFVSRHIDTALSRRGAAEALHAANLELEARVQRRTIELDNANARLQHENSHDALTGLSNRSHLLRRLTLAWDDYRDADAQLVVMFIDLDRFKAVNDSLGHHFGDLLLTQAAERLRGCLRAHDLLARVGGDEFAVLAPGASLDMAVAIAERILTAFDLPFHIDEHVVFSSCSIGIVSADRQFHAEPEDLLRDADTAMYRVKNSGRDSYVVFNHELRREVSDQVEREGALRNALKRSDELVPYFQPIVCAKSGRTVALEALIRWRQPDGTVIAPGEFLPAVEGLRLIGRLDIYMLTRIAEILATPEHADLPPVHVNCSSYSMTREDFAEDVLTLLASHGVAPSRICLELTEGALVAEPGNARRTMQRLADQGMSVVLDDFGSGFSSLNYVHQYQFSGLKIDKSFIVGLTASARSRAIVQAIVRMADSLGLTVVAEGVEDAATVGVLREIGATQAQGYHFARPMPLGELLRAGRTCMEWRMQGIA